MKVLRTCSHEIGIVFPFLTREAMQEWRLNVFQSTLASKRMELEFKPDLPDARFKLFSCYLGVEFCLATTERWYFSVQPQIKKCVKDIPQELRVEGSIS